MVTPSTQTDLSDPSGAVGTTTMLSDDEHDEGAQGLIAHRTQ